MYTEDIMSFFPLKEARRSQELVIREIDKAYRTGTRTVILEAPVGSGKSAIGVTFARAFGSSHTITPRKSLQDQYYADFSDDLVLMKGRSSYPCTINSGPGTIRQVLLDISKGQVQAPVYGAPNCATAPCRSDPEIWRDCKNNRGGCPYSVAIEVAQKSDIIVHNLHSFIFQTAFTERFDKREIMIIDEVHEVEGMLREFLVKKITVGEIVPDSDMPTGEFSSDVWMTYLLQDKFVPEVNALERSRKIKEPEYETGAESYIRRVTELLSGDGKYVPTKKINFQGRKEISTTFEFTPVSLGSAAEDSLLSYGERQLLMSGTIYDKDVFCRTLGLDPKTVHFIRIGSTFPLKNRPIYMKPDYQVNTSFAKWNENFEEMMDKIQKISAIFDDVKGLIHAPSYEAAHQIAAAFPNKRAYTHDKNNFQHSLESFFEEDSNRIFISPVCQQGVDFKNDRARFQIITRVPFLSTQDPFVEYQIKNNFPWYNHQALVTWGQQCGRINRNEEDYGATFCLDSRFHEFIRKNAKKIPKWMMDSLIYK